MLTHASVSSASVCTPLTECDPVPVKLPPPPHAVREAQAHLLAGLDPEVADGLRRLLAAIEARRREHAARVGWHPAQAGWLYLRVSPRPRSAASYRHFVHVVIADRELETGATTDRNPRLFAMVDARTGELYKVSAGRVVGSPRGSVLDDSAVRAVTPFGVEHR